MAVTFDKERTALMRLEAAICREQLALRAAAVEAGIEFEQETAVDWPLEAPQPVSASEYGAFLEEVAEVGVLV